MQLLTLAGESGRRNVLLVFVIALIAASCSATPTITTVATTVSADSPNTIDSAAIEAAAIAPVVPVPAAAEPATPQPTQSAEAVPTSPNPAPEPTEMLDAPGGENPALDVVRGLIRTPLSEAQLAVHEQACRTEGKALRWVGNSVEVSNVTVAGDPWASSLAAESAEKDDYGYDDEGRSNLCVSLVSAPTELRACGDDRESGGRGPIELEGVQAVAILDDAAGRRILATSTVLFGSCPYERDDPALGDLLAQIEATDGRLPSDLRLSWFESYMGDLLDFAVAMDRVPPFQDSQCHALTAALVARADYVVAANETFGMESYGRFGPGARVPTAAETRQLLDQLRVAGRVGARAQKHFFVPRTWLLRAFDVDEDAASPVASVFSETRWNTSTPHEAVARFTQDAAWRPTRSDAGEMLRRGLAFLEAGCTDAQIAATDIAGAPGMEAFDVNSSDPSIFCGWLQASYGYRLEHRRALASGDFDTADDMNSTLFSLDNQDEDLFRIERFLGETGIYAMVATERSVASLVDPNKTVAPNFDVHAPGYQESQDYMDEFAKSRCDGMPAFLFDVPTLAEIQAGGSPAPDDLPPLPESDEYRTRCEDWNNFYDTRAALWSQLPDAPTTTAPSAELLAARRAFDKSWVAKQGEVAMRPGFAQLIDQWNVMTQADRDMWLAATEAQSLEIDTDQLFVAEQAVLGGVLHACQADERFDAAIAITPLPALAES